MAFEHTLIFETHPAIPFTVADGTGITKGALLKMTDPMTAIINSGSQDVIAGVAKTDKIASDGVTKLAVYRRGIFKGTISGSVTVGDPLVTSTTVNHLATALNANMIQLSGSKIVGVALETGTTGETILYELNPQFGLG